MTWLIDTLVWTGALIAFVLVARRAVARHFGPRAAYALWLLPLIRLAVPPIVLPAWLAPAVPLSEAPGEMVVLVPAAYSSAALAAAPPAAPFDWTAAIVAVWLAGAALYGALRVASYFRLRRELLAQARTVGQAGRVRLVETPATASPLAFGVFDKVVALPPEFMAWTDRKAPTWRWHTSWHTTARMIWRSTSARCRCSRCTGSTRCRGSAGRRCGATRRPPATHG